MCLLLIVDGDLSINKALFLKTRAYNKEAASLVSSGPWGYIHFWNVFHGGRLMSRFCGVRIKYFKHLIIDYCYLEINV